MINTLLLLVILLFTTLQAQWGYLSSYPLSIQVYDVATPDGITFFYPSDDGRFYKTIDRGVSYQIVPTDLFTRILCLSFVNSSIGFAGAEGGYLLRTTDGGNTWQSTQPAPGKNISYVKFINNLHGFLLTGTNEIFKTTDAGFTWTSYPLPPGFIPFRIAFYDGQTGLITSKTEMLRTTDGCATWTNVNLPPRISSVYILNPQTTFAGGDSAKIYKSTDKGLTWQLHFKGAQIEIYTIEDIAFADSNRGLFVSGYSLIFTTLDGGISFTAAPRPWYLNHFNKLYIDKANDVYFIETFGGIFKSTDFGIVWNYQDVRYPYALFASDNAKSGFITVGQSGFGVYQNNFTGFDKMPVLTHHTYRSVSFNGNDIGWIVGDSGVICRAGRYESDWRILNSGVTANLRSVYRHPTLTVIGAVGENGTFLWSTVSGFNWTQKPTPVNSHLNAVTLINEQTVVVAGDGGVILRTTNSGDNWSIIPSGTTEDLLTVHSAENVVMIGGKNGFTLRSFDSGVTWSNNNITISQDIISFKFINKLLVRFLTSDGKTFVSSNSGLSWRNEYTFPETDITSFAFSGTGYSLATRRAGYVLMESVSLPVELTSFSGTAQGNEIVLAWSTASEINNRGFEIQRSRDGVLWNAIGFSAGQGTTTLTNSYIFHDKFPDPGKNYYRLKQSDFDGTSQYSSVVEVVLTSSYFLGDNYPNPFNPITKIAYHLSISGFTVIEIFDALGNKLDEPVSKYLEAGSHTLIYDASALTSGIYLYRIRSGNFSQTKRMMVLK